MTNQVTPDAAVEAAWDKLHENPARPIGIAYSELQAALEEAAPYIRAQALEEAAEFVTSPRAKTTDADLARAGAVQEWLRRRAATYRTIK